jgi:hypothetical protein
MATSPPSNTTERPSPGAKEQAHGSTQNSPAKGDRKLAPKGKMQLPPTQPAAPGIAQPALPGATQPAFPTNAPILTPNPEQSPHPHAQPAFPSPAGPTPSRPRITALQIKLDKYRSQISGLELRLKRLETVRHPDADQREILKDLRPWLEDQQEEYDRWFNNIVTAVQWDYLRWLGQIDERGLGILEGILEGLEKEMEGW